MASSCDTQRLINTPTMTPPAFRMRVAAVHAIKQLTIKVSLSFQIDKHLSRQLTTAPVTQQSSKSGLGGSVARLAAEAVIWLGCTYAPVYAPAVSGRRILPVSSCCIMPCFKARALSSFWVNACSSLSISDKIVAMAVCSSLSDGMTTFKN